MDKVGYWVPEKKRKKLNFEELGKYLKEKSIELVQLDFHRPLVDQGSTTGPFSVIIHKLTDVVTQAHHGDNKAIAMLQSLEDYMKLHPDTVVLDPLESVRILMDRNRSYQVLQKRLESNPDIRKVARVPNFVEIHTTDEAEIRQRLEEANVGFPLVCKHIQAHGSVMSHKMALIFNEAGLKDIKPPCVAQTFINHNALLHKMFVVGDEYFLVQRPSVKNFTIGGSQQNTIFFDSHDVSKSNSTSFLNELDETDEDSTILEPCSITMKSLADSIRGGMNMALIGVDVIIEKRTGIHYVIDVNAFPGYDGVPNFMRVLANYIERVICLPRMHMDHSSLQLKEKIFRENGSLSNGFTISLQKSIGGSIEAEKSINGSVEGNRSTTLSSKEPEKCKNVLGVRSNSSYTLEESSQVTHTDCLDRDASVRSKRLHCEVTENGIDCNEVASKKSPVSANGLQNGTSVK